MKRLTALTMAVALALILAPAGQADEGVYVKDGGKLGIGDFSSTNPINQMHLKSATSIAAFAFSTPSVTWRNKIGANGNYFLSKVGSPAGELTIRDANNPTWTLKVEGPIQATAFNVASSRALKHDFEEVSSSELLAGVASLPISRWRYKDDPHGTPHIGPMAEDFHATFGGAGDTSISLSDATGVALGAIQELHREAREKDRLIAELASRIEQLERRLAER